MTASLYMLDELGIAAGTLLASRSLIHYFQLESYQLPGFYRTVRRKMWPCFRPGVFMGIAALVLSVGAAFIPAAQGGLSGWVIHLFLMAAMVGCGYLMGRIFDDKKAKKPLVITPRIKRLGVISFLVNLVMLWLLELLRQALIPGVQGFLPFLAPLLVAVAGGVAAPVEGFINELYFRDAQKILKARPDLIKIGITGSYGKTSVKFILGTMLAEKYQTLVTPSSFNTPMGVTKVIRNKLQPGHQVFVAEMGARHVGDIKELCRLVHPTIGVLTSVGPQHLNTFKTIDRIKSTKYELMDAIPSDGLCVFFDDGNICRELYDKTGKKKLLCSLQPGADSDVWAENIRVGSRGSTFDLCTTDGRVSCETRLLGEHNITNILLSTCVCLQLGLTMKQIARGIAKLQPVEHRLQLIDNPGGMAIIDDAFNSNPQSAGRALKVLKQFEGRRIVITPGMVELGSEEADYNKTFGMQMADCVDEAILVGKKHVQPILEGLKEAGFPEEHTHRVDSLNEATALLREMGRAGDTVLFENDLPDNYNE